MKCFPHRVKRPTGFAVALSRHRNVFWESASCNWRVQVYNMLKRKQAKGEIKTKFRIGRLRNKPECPNILATHSPEWKSMMEMLLSEQLVARNVPEGSNWTYRGIRSQTLSGLFSANCSLSLPPSLSLSPSLSI